MEKKPLKSSSQKSFNIYNDPKHSFTDQSSESFIFLVLDCYSYIAGEKVTGEILLSIAEPLSQVSLKLHSKGQEEVQVFSYQDRSQKLVEESSEVFSLDTEVCKWDHLQVGQFVFPFNFKLPAYSPATFYYSCEDPAGNYIKAEVIYSISVKLELKAGHSLTHSRIVHVKNSRSLERPAPSIEANSTLTGCFFNKGNTSFKLNVGNVDHCIVGGDVRYKLLPDNSHCKAPINQIIGAILIDFEVVTKKGSFRVLKKLSEANRATWISAFTSMIYEKDFEYQADLKVPSEELNPGSNQSAIIRCEYFIECSVFYDIPCMKHPIVIRLPFHVNPKVNYRKEDPALPYNWSPVESPIFSFIVRSSDRDDERNGSTPNNAMKTA